MIATHQPIESSLLRRTESRPFSAASTATATDKPSAGAKSSAEAPASGFAIPASPLETANAASVRIAFTVLGTPQGKGRARSRIVSLTGKTAFVSHYTPAKTREYEDGIAWAAKAAMRGRQPLDEPLRLGIVIRCPIPASWSKKDTREALANTIRPTGKPDADNVYKTVADAMNGIVFRDDSLIVEAAIAKFYSQTPGISVSVESLQRAIDPFHDQDANALRQQQLVEDQA